MPSTARRRFAVAGIAAVVVVAAVALLVLRAHYKSWAWQSVPDQLSICGREYLGPGHDVTLAQLTAGGAHLIGHVTTLRGTHEIWGVQDGPVGARCGTGVFVRTGSVTFRAYALSGGP